MSFEADARKQAQILTDTLAEATKRESAKAIDALVKTLCAAVQQEAEVITKQAKSDAQQQSAQKVSELQRDADAKLGQLQRESDAKIAQAKAETKQVRQELEARLGEVQSAHATLTKTLADVQGELMATRSELDARTAALRDAEERARNIDDERRDFERTRSDSINALEKEVKRANLLTESLDAARHDADKAIAEAAEIKKELRALQQSKGGVPAPAGESSEAIAALLERIGVALRSITAATSGTEIFETLIEHLSQLFGRVAIFQVAPTGSVKAWRGRGFDKSDLSKIAIPASVDTLLARAVSDKKTVGPSDGGKPAGLNGPVASLVALPIVANGKVVAIAYAEDADGKTAALSSVGCKGAEILIEQASRRLTTKTPAKA